MHCEAEGLVVSSLTQPTVARLRDVVPAAASVTNPVDLLASASAEDYRHALSLLLRDPNVDSVIALYVPVLADDAGAVASAIGAAARETGEKPLLATFLDAQGVAGRLSGVPCFAYPESAARALGRAARYASWRARPLGQVPELSAFDGGRVRERVEAALARGGGWLGQPEVTAVLEAAGIVLQPARLARSLSEAIAASRDLRFPVALKAQGPTIVHKTGDRRCPSRPARRSGARSGVVGSRRPPGVVARRRPRASDGSRWSGDAGGRRSAAAVRARRGVRRGRCHGRARPGHPVSSDATDRRRCRGHARRAEMRAAAARVPGQAAGRRACAARSRCYACRRWSTPVLRFRSST